MAVNRDPLGCYSILGVHPSASLQQIRKAFKARAQELHPDRNSSEAATRDFQRLNDAYQRLSNASSRSEYDAKSYVPAQEKEQRNGVGVQPIACCACGKISIQPRYVIYRQVVSALFATYRSDCQGVFCAKCGAKRAYRTSGVTWLLGWWGLPWGPIYSIQAIGRNMLGEQPALTNFRILAMQAAHFASKNRMDIARLLADQALEFVPQIFTFCSTQESSADRDLRALLAVIRDSTPTPVRPLKRSWGFQSLPFRIQALAPGVFGIVLAAFVVSGASHAGTAYCHMPPSNAFDQATLSGGMASGSQVSGTDIKARIQEGVPFSEPPRPLPPTGRMRILHKRSRDVTAPLNIVTYRGSPNYYLKLVDLDTGVPVLFLFIRSGESVSVEVPLGRYELRLANGGNWYGERYLFGPQTGYSKADTELMFEHDRDAVAGYTLRLEKQVDGNLREAQMAPSDF